jgi:hypothetical protein
MRSKIRRWNLEMKSRFQIIKKSIQILFSTGIQLPDLLFIEMYFSVQYGVTRSLLAKFHQIPKFQDFPLNFD